MSNGSGNYHIVVKLTKKQMSNMEEKLCIKTERKMDVIIFAGKGRCFSCMLSLLMVYDNQRTKRIGL